MTVIGVAVGERRFRADTAQAIDLSIPLRFGGVQPNHFGAPEARAEPLQSGAFVGDTRRGGSCNAERYTLVPHCNGTHTECIGHVTDERIGLRDLDLPSLMPARVVTLDAAADDDGDMRLTGAVLGSALGNGLLAGIDALVVRTLPNSASKRTRRYDVSAPTPYFTADAMHRLVAEDIRHLLVDMPSIDRLDDGGKLAAHRIFWGLPPDSRDHRAATRAQATVSEMIYVPDAAPDGLYLLNLQIAPFATDAAPSRPLLYPLEPL